MEWDGGVVDRVTVGIFGSLPPTVKRLILDAVSPKNVEGGVWWVDLERLDSEIAQISRPLYDAVKRKGGLLTVSEVVQKIRMTGISSIGLAYGGTTPDQRLTSLHGYGLIARERPSARSRVIVMPHVGPMWNVVVQLLVDGHKVALFSELRNLSPTSLSAMHRCRRMLSFKSTSVCRFIGVPSNTSLLAAVDALRNGFIVIWNPDVGSQTDSSKKVDCDFVGCTIAGTSAIATLVKASNQNPLLAETRLSGERALVEATFSEIDLTGLSRDELVQKIYASSSEIILNSVDQWQLLASWSRDQLSQRKDG